MASPAVKESHAPDLRDAGHARVAQNGPQNRPQNGPWSIDLVGIDVAAGRSGWLLSCWATIHLVLVAISCLAGVAPSSIQSSVLSVCRPYLSVLHLDAEGNSLAPSLNLPAEKTHELQVLASGDVDDGDWQADLASFTKSDYPTGFLNPSVDNQRGVAGGCRQRRWQRLLARTAELGELDQASLAAWFIEPMVQQMTPIDQLRIVRLPDLMTTVVDDNAASPYQVAIVPGSTENQYQFIQLPAKRLVAPTVKRTPAATPLDEKSPAAGTSATKESEGR